MSDPKLIANLDSIVKQLQKISATIGVSVGVSDKGGKPKIKSTLESNEKTRAKNLFKETEQQYENVLGRAFNATRSANAKANATEFISSLKGTTLISNMDKVKDGIKTLVSKTSSTTSDAYLNSINQSMLRILVSQKDYEPKLNEILVAMNGIALGTSQKYYEPKLNEILVAMNALVSKANSGISDAYLYSINQLMIQSLASQKDYEPKLNEILVEMKTLQDVIKNSIQGASIKPQTVLRMFEILIKKMKWEDFRVSIMDHIIRSEIASTDLNKNVEDLLQVNKDILNKKTPATGGASSALAKLGSVAGLMALGVGLAVIVSALMKANLIEPSKVFKVLGVVGAIVALFVGVSLVANKIKNAAIGFGIFSATILFIIIPMMYAFAKMPITILVEGLAKMGLVMLVCTVLLGLLGLASRFTKDSVYKAVGGLALFALTIGFLILPLIKHIVNFPLEELIEGMAKISGIILVCIGIMKLASMVDAKQATFSLGGILIFSLMLKFLIIPLLLDMAKLEWKTLLYGIANAAIAIVGLGGIAFIIGQMAKSVGMNMVLGALVIAGLTLIMGYLANTLDKFAGKDWKEIYKGLGLATLAITLFGLVVAGIGFIVANPLSAILLGAGAIAILALSFVAGYLADSLAKFANKNWDEITSALKQATLAITAFGFVVGAMGVVAILGMPFMVAGAGLMMYLANTAGLLAANLEAFADRDWNTIIPGLMGASKGMAAFGAVVAGMGLIVKVFGMEMIEAGASAVFELSLVAGYMAENLMKFAYRPWTSIIKGLTQSTKAMKEFSLFVGGVGLFSKIVESGVDVVFKISDLIGNIADNLMKYSDVSQIDFKTIGEGLSFLGEGLKAMFFGSLANVGSSIIDGAMGFFKSDPVSKIKKFESIDSKKIYELGLGLKFMGEGLSTLTKDLDLTNLIKDLSLLSKPVIDLAYGISEFSDAYVKFQAVRMDSDLEQIKNINVQNENGLKDTIRETGQLQIEVLRDQLTEIRRTNELMETLISNTINNNPNQQNQSSATVQNGNKSSTSLTSPAFSTKDNYRNNLKLTAMSIQG